MQKHMETCKFTKIPCPNKLYGCSKLLLQGTLREHLDTECRFMPVECPWCSKKVHNKEVGLSIHDSDFVISTDTKIGEYLYCLCSIILNESVVMW